MTTSSPRILELTCRDRFGAAPCGRPDVANLTGPSGSLIQTDAVEGVPSTGPPEAMWSQQMIYIIFPNGLCLQFEQDKIIRIFYIEDQPSTDNQAIKYFLREACRFCDDITLTSLDPSVVRTRIPQWRLDAITSDESRLLDAAEQLTHRLTGPRNDQVDDILEFIRRDD